MMIETTYMKFGKDLSGMIGITTKPRSVHSLVEFTEQDEKVIRIHREEVRARLFSDQERIY